MPSVLYLAKYFIHQKLNLQKFHALLIFFMTWTKEYS